MDKKEIESKWRYLMAKISDDFKTDADMINVLYLIGIQESGSGFGQYTKDEKTELIKIGNHKVLSYFDFYRLAGQGTYGWPVFEETKPLDDLSQQQKDELIQEGIIRYFLEMEYL